MWRTGFLILFSLFILGQLSHSREIVELFSWRLTTDSISMVVPRLDGESRTDALRRYFRGLITNEEMLAQVDYERINLNQITRTGHLNSIPFRGLAQQSAPTILLMANMIDYMVPHNWWLENYQHPLEAAGARVFLLPVAYDLGMSEQEAHQFRQQIALHFDSLFALGGDDIHPALYQDDMAHAINTNLTRDLSEIKLIHQFVMANRGPIYGVCRGSQMCSIAMGSSLNQDLFHETEKVGPHADVWHDITLRPFNDSLLYHFVGEQEKLRVYSFHHQATKGANPRLQISAYSEEEGGHRVIEGIQTLDGMMVGIQFHPELMKNREGDLILQGFVDYARFIKEQRRSGRGCVNKARDFIRRPQSVK